MLEKEEQGPEKSSDKNKKVGGKKPGEEGRDLGKDRKKLHIGQTNKHMCEKAI